MRNIAVPQFQKEYVYSTQTCTVGLLCAPFMIFAFLGIMGPFFCLSRSKAFGENKKTDVHVRCKRMEHKSCI